MNKIYTSKIILQIEELPIELLSVIKAAAISIGINNIAIVGGSVRDSLINLIHSQKINKFKDIDLIIEGSAKELANVIERRIDSNRISEITYHEDYDTVLIVIDSFRIDLTSSRIEKYETLGENPTIFKSDLKSDLIRRDFTINSIAINLINEEILDPFNGQKDIEIKSLEFLHCSSAAEDPTRIIRAARYASRLGFNISTNSREQINSTIEKWPWSWKIGDHPKLAPAALSVRLRMEMELLLNHEPWTIALKYLQDWGALLLLDENIQLDRTWEKRIKWAKKLEINPFTALLVVANEPLILSKRLQINKNQQRLILESIEIKNFLSVISKNNKCDNWLPSKWSKELEKYKWKIESIKLILCCEIPQWNQLYKWLTQWRKIESPVSAADLISQGWSQGPALGRELKKLRYQQIDMQSQNKKYKLE